MKTHHYLAFVDWKGNQGKGTSGYADYERDFSVRIDGKEQVLRGSADSAFLGNPHRFNPEELLIASISSCHMLWYLHLCADNGIIVLEYADSASGKMIEFDGGGGKFESVTLSPLVTVASAEMVDLAKQLHQEAHNKCFISNSCNFPIGHEITVNVQI